MEETQKDNTPIKTVLLVEDDADIRESLAQFLKEETPYQVIAASDGFAALKLVRTITPHLIVLDYQLPGMTGLECLEALRTTKGLEHTPVILMSANFPEQVKEEINVVKLEKPFEMEHFLTQVKHFLDGEVGVH
jgi:CheY-like chemotaxis protein